MLPFDLPEYPKEVTIGSPEVGHFKNVKVSLGLTLGEENTIKKHLKPFEDDYRQAFRNVALSIQKTEKKDLMTVGKAVTKAVASGDLDALSLYISDDTAQSEIEALSEALEKRDDAQTTAYALVAAKRKRADPEADFDPETVTTKDIEALPRPLKYQLSIFSRFESGGATLKHIDTATKTFYWDAEKQDKKETSGFGEEEDEESLKNS